MSQRQHSFSTICLATAITLAMATAQQAAATQVSTLQQFQAVTAGGWGSNQSGWKAVEARSTWDTGHGSGTAYASQNLLTATIQSDAVGDARAKVSQMVRLKMINPDLVIIPFELEGYVDWNGQVQGSAAAPATAQGQVFTQTYPFSGYNVQPFASYQSSDGSLVSWNQRQSFENLTMHARSGITFDIELSLFIQCERECLVNALSLHLESFKVPTGTLIYFGNGQPLIAPDASGRYYARDWVLRSAGTVPEPSAWASMAAGALVLSWALRRRSHRLLDA